MKLNAVMVQKALNQFSSAIYYFSQAIEPSAEDIVGFNALRKAQQALATAQVKAQKENVQEKPQDPPKAEKTVKPASPKKDQQASGLPEKPMKLATMEAYLKTWLPKAKASQVKQLDSFMAGMGCSVDGVEHIVKALYNNSVVLVNRKGTQYHRLVPVEKLDHLFPKDTGVTAEYSNGQKVEVGYGVKSASVATSFRPAVINSIRGQFVQVKYLDNGTSSGAKLSQLRPLKG